MVSDINQDISQPVPACQKCGRRDETLRAVVFPFVFSLIVITYRRSFAGIWCARHRRGYLSLASLITAVGGWLGIPYGFVFTPLALFTLARGGNQSAEENSRILLSVAELKLSEGNLNEAIRCLEESLRFQDSPEVRQHLSSLYQQRHLLGVAGDASALTPLLVVPFLFFLSTLIGLGMGMLDLLAEYLLAPLFNSGGNILVAILSWIPFAALMFFDILLIRSLVGWAMKKMRIASVPLALALSLGASLTGIYQVLNGRALFTFVLGDLFTAFSYSLQDALFAGRAYLAYGGFMQIVNVLKFNGTAGIIYVLLALAATGLSLYVTAMHALQMAKWQTRLGEILKPEEINSSLAGWLGFLGVSTFSLFAFLILSGGMFVNVGEALVHVNAATTALNENDIEKGAMEYRSAANVWPDSVIGHTGLAVAHMKDEDFDGAVQELNLAHQRDPQSAIVNFFLGLTQHTRGEFDLAVDSFNSIIETAPGLGLPHAYLALTYYQLDQMDISKDEIQKAISLGQEDSQTLSAISGYYAWLHDFDNAKTYIQKAIDISDDPVYSIYLARIYISRQEYDSAQESIERIQHEKISQSLLRTTRANLAVAQQDLELAADELLGVLDELPRDSIAMSDLSFVYFQMGRFDDAVGYANKALEINPYNYDAHIERAFALHAQGKFSTALESAQRGVALSPKNDRGHYILGLCYMESNVVSQAIEEFETFLNLYWERPYMIQYKANAEEYLKRLK